MFKLATSSGSGAARSPGCGNSTTEKVGSMGGGSRREAVSWSSVLTWPQQPHKRLVVGGALPEGGGHGFWAVEWDKCQSKFKCCWVKRKHLYNIKWCRMYNTIVVTKYYYNRAGNFCLKKFLPFLPPTKRENFCYLYTIMGLFFIPSRWWHRAYDNLYRMCQKF